MPQPLVAEETTSFLVSIPERLCLKRDPAMSETVAICLDNAVLGVGVFAPILMALLTMFMGCRIGLCRGNCEAWLAFNQLCALANILLILESIRGFVAGHDLPETAVRGAASKGVSDP